jgi:hypothetical protein
MFSCYPDRVADVVVNFPRGHITVAEVAAQKGPYVNLLQRMQDDAALYQNELDAKLSCSFAVIVIIMVNEESRIGQANQMNDVPVQEETQKWQALDRFEISKELMVLD